MKLLIALLCVVSILHFSKSKQCGVIPPKLELMNRGVDITKLVLMPLVHNEDTGFARKITDFTCNQGRQWTSPYNRQLTFDLPDQIEKINTIPGGILDVTFKHHWSMEDVKKSIAMDAGIGAKAEGGMFSSSSTYKRFQTLITQNANKVSELESSTFAYQVDLKPFWKLNMSNNALIYLNKLLPNTFEQNPEMYYTFFGYFGTHFISRAKFGGKLRMSFVMESSLLESLTKSEFEIIAKTAFFSLVHVNKNLTDESTYTRDEFNQKTQIIVRFYGGTANLLDASDIINWWHSVPDNPWLFNCELEPIFNLIPDNPKKEDIRKAYRAYLDISYLSELERTLLSIIPSHKYGVEKAAEYIKIIKDLKSYLIPNHRKTHHLGHEIKGYFFPPKWFLTQTKICYTLAPFDNSIECNPKYECAKPNTKTAAFKYNSEVSASKCYVSWTLQSTSHESWFQQVKICVRTRRSLLWLPITLSVTERCAAVNDFTVDSLFTRPSTFLVIDKRRWKLSVPENSPSWILNTKICVHVNLEKFGGYCGNGFNRTICAFSNEWTTHERLLTENNACLFSWSLQTD